MQLIVRFITGSCYQNSKRELHNFDSRCEPHVCRAAGTDLRLQTCPLQRQLCVCSGIKREATTYFCSDEIALVTTTATTTTKNRPVMTKPRVPLSASQNTAVVAAKRGRKVHKKLSTAAAHADLQQLQEVPFAAINICSSSNGTVATSRNDSFYLRHQPPRQPLLSCQRRVRRLDRNYVLVTVTRVWAAYLLALFCWRGFIALL